MEPHPLVFMEVNEVEESTDNMDICIVTWYTFNEKGLNYTAAHSAKGADQATKLHLFYDRPIINDDSSDDSNGVLIPLCNIHPSEAATVPNGYSLSRNTRYYFTIHLKKSSATTPDTPGTTRSVEYGEQPGEIIVYLP